MATPASAERTRYPIAFVVLAVAVLAVHFGASLERPMHTDEAVNAVILGHMLEGEPLRYDPQDRHGPTLLMAAYPIARVTGARSLAGLESWPLRLVPAFAFAGLILLLPAMMSREEADDAVPNKGTGFRPMAVRYAALWFIAGAPCVYFGGSFIHESLFNFLALGTIVAVWRYLVRPRVWSALAAGAGGGLLVATKETVAITGIAILLALIVVRLTTRGVAWTRPRTRTLWRDAGLALAVALVVAVLLFSSFGANPSGPVDAVHGWFRFVGRAAGEGHEKPWFTYARWLLVPNARSFPWFGWSLLFLGATGAREAWRERCATGLPWFFTVYAMATAVVYSTIPYKTPWLMLNFIVPMALAAGLGLERIVRTLLARSQALSLAALLLCALIAAGMASETRQLCLRFPVDPTNPLAYSPTVEDATSIESRIRKALAATGEEPGTAVIQVVGDDYWPLPWYLRRFPNVGYWAELPESGSRDVIIVTGSARGRIGESLGSDWRPEFVGLRPEVLALVYYRKEAE